MCNSVKNSIVKNYETLYVREITAPNGYLLNRDWFEFTKQDGGNSSENSPIATIQNQKAEAGKQGRLTVYRYDENTLEPLSHFQVQNLHCFQILVMNNLFKLV